jgi:hypothetical protein
MSGALPLLPLYSFIAWTGRTSPILHFESQNLFREPEILRLSRFPLLPWGKLREDRATIGTVHGHLILLPNQSYVIALNALFRYHNAIKQSTQCQFAGARVGPAAMFVESLDMLRKHGYVHCWHKELTNVNAPKGLCHLVNTPCYFKSRLELQNLNFFMSALVPLLQ